jgi:hypothetical protein
MDSVDASRAEVEGCLVWLLPEISEPEDDDRSRVVELTSGAVLL